MDIIVTLNRALHAIPSGDLISGFHYTMNLGLSHKAEPFSCNMYWLPFINRRLCTMPHKVYLMHMVL